MDHCEVMIIVPVGTPILIMLNIRSHYPSLSMLNERLKDCNLFSFLQLILIFQLDFNNLIDWVHGEIYPKYDYIRGGGGGVDSQSFIY